MEDQEEVSRTFKYTEMLCNGLIMEDGIGNRFHSDDQVFKNIEVYIIVIYLNIL